MLTSPTHLRDELIELDAELGALRGRRLALLGFRDPNAKRVNDNLQSLWETPGWTVVDLRNALVPSPESLTKALGAPKLALLMDVSSRLPSDASLLIRALHDSHDAVQWMNGTQSPLPAQRMVYIIAAGARSFEDLPELLQRIDFMKFLRPLK